MATLGSPNHVAMESRAERVRAVETCVRRSWWWTERAAAPPLPTLLVGGQSRVLRRVTSPSDVTVSS